MNKKQKDKLKTIIFNRLELDIDQGDPVLFDNFLNKYNFEKCWHVQKSTEDFFSHYWVDILGNKVRNGKNKFILPFPHYGTRSVSIEIQQDKVLLLEEGFKMDRDLALKILILGYLP